VEECLLGFDARASWYKDTRDVTFLLRDDTGPLLSADTMVWPSIFNRGFPRVSELERPSWIGQNDPFWENLAELESAIPDDAAWLQGPYWLIAATWHAEAEFDKEKRESIGGYSLGPWKVPTNPPRRDPDWRFLGFDVTDGGFLSGLSNCGYTAEERPRLVQQWTSFLNRHHLFDELEKAFEFRQVSNARVKEHAPFFVIGLWLIRIVS
jgi:hypothetical protein